MKKVIITILKFTGKVVLKLLKLVFALPMIALYFGSTYNYDNFDKELKKL